MPDDFDAAWQIYPRKIAKAAARKAWAKIHNGTAAKIMEALPKHIEIWRACGEPEFIPHFSSWLNGERWEDELTPEIQATPKLATVQDLLAVGKTRGIEARPGESADDFRRRVMQTRAA